MPKKRAQDQEHEFIFPDRGIRRSRLSHFAHIAVLDVTVIACSCAAVFYSLGYKVNPTTHSLQRTGLIAITTQLSRVPGTVSLDGAQVATELPFRSKPLFPGTYTLKISRDGYQPWQRSVQVQPNKVVTFKYVILVLNDPQPVAVSEGDRSYLANSQPDDKDVDVRVNELWVGGEFITRVSQDIAGAQWYADRGHVAYQAGNKIWLLELSSRQTQLLATLSTEESSRFRFKSGGKVMVYDDAGIVRAVRLY